MIKHLNETIWQSGIHPLYSSEAMHDTHYKHVGMTIEKRYPIDSDETLHMKWQIAYISKTKSKEPTFAKILQTKHSALKNCLNCDSS